MLLAYFISILALTSAYPKKPINVSVMVPGITAFSNLVIEAEILYENQRKFESTNIEEYSNAGYVAFPKGKYDSERVYSDDGLFDEENLNHVIKNHQFAYPWSFAMVKVVLDIALEEIETTKGLLDEYRINLQYYDSANEFGKSSARTAQIASVDSLINDHMTALIGPMNAYAMSRVLTFSSHYEIIHFTPGGISEMLRRNKPGEESRNTMVRTGLVAGMLGDCIVAMMKYYNWNIAVEVFEDDADERHHYFIAEGIFDRMSLTDNLHPLKQERFSEYLNENKTRYGLDELLQNIEKEARILLLSADTSVIVDFMKQASIDHDSDEYAYVIIDLENKLGGKPWNDKLLEKESENMKSKIKRRFESALIVTFAQLDDKKIEDFSGRVSKKLSNYGDEHSNLTHLLLQKLVDNEKKKYGAKSLKDYLQKNQYLAFFHDSLLLLAHLLNATLPRNRLTYGYENSMPKEFQHDPWPSHSGKNMYFHELQTLERDFKGITGSILFDEVGDRKLNFSIWDYNPKTDEFEVAAHFDASTNIYKELTEVFWPNSFPPPDEPPCGFDGRKCSEQGLTTINAVILSISVSAFLIIATIAASVTIRNYKLQKELESQLWRVYWHDIKLPTMSDDNESSKSPVSDQYWEEDDRSTTEEVGENFSSTNSFSDVRKRIRTPKRKKNLSSKRYHTCFVYDQCRAADQTFDDNAIGQFTVMALYKDKPIMLKHTDQRKVELNRSILMELKHMRDITHEHLARFEGACVDYPHICILTEYCGKGSLKDILLNDEIKMDWMFRVSLMNDLVKGMSFLHNSAIERHGNLKSSNCVVDSRFVLKIADYGLFLFRRSSSSSEQSQQEYNQTNLWTAPEVLRRANDMHVVSQKADVYSFGIILQEIALRKGPFYLGNTATTYEEIISKVRGGCKPYFRPLLDTSTLNEDFCNLMEKCWHEDPNERPDFILTKKIIDRYNKDNPGNLVENLLHRMEQYAINLEGLVEERTAAYLEEKVKADKLLYQMLPVPVVNRLKRGDSIPAEAFESVTICFTDIVGFTSLSAASSPMQIVDLLNDLYTCFDGIIENYDVYKVETIGDAYMLVSGLPVRNGIRHACEIARTSLHLLKAVSDFKIRHRPNDRLNLRLGIHSGPCCAGVVGLKMPRYCLFGDTVNTASRMESNGMPLSIHVSEPTKELLDKHKSFKLELRGEIPMKGKGTLTTYWLLEETSQDSI